MPVFCTMNVAYTDQWSVYKNGSL